MRILAGLILRAVALAMGVSAAVTVLLGEGTYKRVFLLLAAGLICLALASLEQFSRGFRLVSREEPEDPGAGPKTEDPPLPL